MMSAHTPNVYYYKYGLRGLVGGNDVDVNNNADCDNSISNESVVEFTRYSILSLLNENSEWNYKIINLYYNLCWCFVIKTQNGAPVWCDLGPCQMNLEQVSHLKPFQKDDGEVVTVFQSSDY